MACQFYEQYYRNDWERSVMCRNFFNQNNADENKLNMVKKFCMVLDSIKPYSNDNSPDFTIFMLKYFMSLIVGVTSGLWIWTRKTVKSWNFFFDKLSSCSCCSASKKEISEENTTKIYYPFLYSKNIVSLKDLQQESGKLVENNKKILNDKTETLFKTVDMFYDVYELNKKIELKYVNRGIKYIKAIIKPEFDINVPLEVIFKIIHANETNPLIKYNPSTRQENIYRLYTDKISTDGRKIPYLKKAAIFKLMKTIAKSKSVSVYIEINSFYI
jgi:hypothetical protein